MTETACCQSILPKSGSEYRSHDVLVGVDGAVVTAPQIPASLSCIVGQTRGSAPTILRDLRASVVRCAIGQSKSLYDLGVMAV